MGSRYCCEEFATHRLVYSVMDTAVGRGETGASLLGGRICGAEVHGDVLNNVYAKGLLKKDGSVLEFLNGTKMKLCRIENGEEEWAGLAWLRDQIARKEER